MIISIKLKNIIPSLLKKTLEIRKTNWSVIETYKLNLQIPTVEQVSFKGKNLQVLQTPNIEPSPMSHSITEILKTFTNVTETEMAFFIIETFTASCCFWIKCCDFFFYFKKGSKVPFPKLDELKYLYFLRCH